MDFFSTVMGKKFYEGTMPKVARNLERIADAMEKANELKERELALQEEKQNREESKSGD